MSSPVEITRRELVRRVRAWERHVDAEKPDKDAPPCPSLAVIDGKRQRYVGFGWVSEGEPHGDEPFVVT